MNIKEYTNMFRAEDSHFFYRATHNAIIALIQSLHITKKTKILDVGCGTGRLVQLLDKYCIAEGVDSYSQAVELGKKRQIRIKKGSVLHLPYPSESFDIVTCIDVLCHRSITDEVDAVKEIRRVLKPGGVLILRVPAHSFLYSNHDAFVMTKKRYDKKTLVKTINQSGLNTTSLTYMNAFLFIPSLIKTYIEKLLNKNKSASVITNISPLINDVMFHIIKPESYFITHHISIPFGIEILAICQKPKN